MEKSLRTFTDHPPVLTLTYFVYVMSFVIKIKFNSIQFRLKSWFDLNVFRFLALFIIMPYFSFEVAFVTAIDSY